jgi:hypothetical protein
MLKIDQRTLPYPHTHTHTHRNNNSVSLSIVSLIPAFTAASEDAPFHTNQLILYYYIFFIMYNTIKLDFLERRLFALKMHNEFVYARDYHVAVINRYDIYILYTYIVYSRYYII